MNLNFISKTDIQDEKRDEKRDESRDEISSKAVEMKLRAEQVLELIRSDPTITIVDMAKKLEISKQKVERAIVRLQEQNLISREGSNRKGEWVIIE